MTHQQGAPAGRPQPCPAVPARGPRGTGPGGGVITGGEPGRAAGLGLPGQRRGGRGQREVSAQQAQLRAELPALGVEGQHRGAKDPLPTKDTQNTRREKKMARRGNEVEGEAGQGRVAKEEAADEEGGMGGGDGHGP